MTHIYDLRRMKRKEILQDWSTKDSRPRGWQFVVYAYRRDTGVYLYVGRSMHGVKRALAQDHHHKLLQHYTHFLYILPCETEEEMHRTEEILIWKARTIFNGCPTSYWLVVEQKIAEAEKHHTGN